LATDQDEVERLDVAMAQWFVHRFIVFQEQKESTEGSGAGPAAAASASGDSEKMETDGDAAKGAAENAPPSGAFSLGLSGGVEPYSRCSLYPAAALSKLPVAEEHVRSATAAVLSSAVTKARVSSCTFECQRVLFCRFNC
jgi:hypothetical protein